MQKVLLFEQLDSVSEYLDKALYEHIKNGQFGKFECHPQANLISFKWLDIHHIGIAPLKIAIYMSKEHLFFFCKDENCLKKAEKLIENNQPNERVLYSFFSEIIRNDIDLLEKLEEKITIAEDELLSSSKKESAKGIITFRRKLLHLKKYYEQLNYIFEGLLENENGIIGNDYLRFFGILNSRIDRLFASVLNLRDYVTQVREAYQAQIDIEQNAIMKVFTVVTAIFLPLSLIAGWYGMNLQMPEFSWKFGYLFVILLSSSIAIISLIIFKIKKWF